MIKNTVKEDNSRDAKFHAKIGGISCSFCAETIRKAYQRQNSVTSVNVSLSHEEVLVRYDPSLTTKDELKKTLTDLRSEEHTSELQSH